MHYGRAEVLRNASVEFAASEMVAVVGPNGAGKSTLLGIMAGLRPSYTGSCRYAGTEVSRWRRREFARRVAVVPQTFRVDFPFTAEQIVLMGRTPYCDGLFETPHDHAAVERAMAVADTLEFRRRDFRSLSGGERQRVVLASALAQEPETLLLDEPTSFLDLKHQLTMYRLLRELSAQGLLVVAVTHDLNLAVAHSDRIIVLDRGRLAADGAPDQILTPDTIRDVFGVEAEVRRGPAGRPLIVYVG